MDKCAYCGKEIFGRDVRAIYCSSECCREADKKHKREKYVGKRLDKCAICGGELPKFKGRYCSIECRRRAEHIKRGNVQTTHEIIRKCVVCGKEFATWKGRKITCSAKCSRKKKDIDRQYRGIIVDSDITLESLAIKNHNQCQICGFFVDWNDYEYKNGYKICGNMYPSIDHILPRSKGGLHSWANVQLAHRKCNSSKCNKIAI